MEKIISPFSKFQLGQVVTTQKVTGDIINTDTFSEFCEKSLQRHKVGDWGDMPEEDKQSNEDALINGNRLFSGYLLPEELQKRSNGSKIWIITEHDRSATTILYPTEY